jgi:uncharacterized membrane protein YfcA
MTSLEILIALTTITVGAFIQGSVGFGLAMISVPVLLLINPEFIPGPLLCATLTLTSLTIYRDRSGIDNADLPWALAGRIIGTPLGLFALASVSRDNLDLMFGSLILFSVLLSASGLRLLPTPKSLIGAGTLSGFMGTTSSIGGPPMALLYQSTEGIRLRGTLAVFFTIGVVISLVALAAVGRFGLRELSLGLLLQPGILAGFFLSSRMAANLDHGYTRQAVLSVAGVLGTVVIIRQLL